MSVQEQKEMSRRALEMWASGHSGKPEDIFAKNYVNHQEPDVQGGISDKNLENWKQLVSDFHKAFSNSKVRILGGEGAGGNVAKVTRSGTTRQQHKFVRAGRLWGRQLRHPVVAVGWQCAHYAPKQARELILYRSARGSAARAVHRKLTETRRGTLAPCEQVVKSQQRRWPNHHGSRLDAMWTDRP